MITQPNCTVRPALDADLDAIEKIERDSFPNPWPRVVLERYISDQGSAMNVATDTDGVVRGYCCFQFVVGEIEIQSIAVDTAVRRRGFAGALMSTIMDTARARGDRRLILEVRAGNEGALGLYRKNGFLVDAVRPRYYPDNEDAVLMSLVVP